MVFAVSGFRTTSIRSQITSVREPRFHGSTRRMVQKRINISIYILWPSSNFASDTHQPESSYDRAASPEGPFRRASPERPVPRGFLGRRRGVTKTKKNTEFLV